MFSWRSKKIIIWIPSLIRVMPCFSGDEPAEEMGENLKHIEIPVDIQEQFHKEDELEKAQTE